MYKSTRDLKREAKQSLKGRWKEAMVLNIVPSIIQIISLFMMMLFTLAIVALIYFMVNNQSDIFNNSASNYASEYNWEMDYDDPGGSVAAAVASSSSTLIFGPVFSFVMTFLTIGISFTFLDVIRKGKQQEMKFKDAFRLFNGIDFVPILLINILTYLFKYFWSLLFFIPGIIKSYSYSQANFIYKDLSSTRDTRSMGATTFITESRQLMKGHKGRLFWLDITFIGWYLLGLLTIGIGFLWINPYINATKAAFYNDLAKDRFLEVEEEPDEEIWTSF